MLRSLEVCHCCPFNYCYHILSTFFSGTPDLTLSFVNPRLMDDVSFHPCVRFKRWENERILSLVPPDGSFCLMNYRVGSQSTVAVPIYIRHIFNLPKDSNHSQLGKIELTVGPRQTMGRVVSLF